MSKNKMKRLIMLIVVCSVLFLLPWSVSMYYVPFYYVGAILLLVIGIIKIVRDKEGKFYNSWQKVRTKGFWKYVWRKGMFSFFAILVIVLLGQLFGNGLTPFQLYSLLTPAVHLLILTLIVVFSILIGITFWYDNERRYFKKS